MSISSLAISLNITNCNNDLLGSRNGVRDYCVNTQPSLLWTDVSRKGTTNSQLLGLINFSEARAGIEPAQ